MFAGVRAPLFLLTALLWLIASVLLGLYLWIAKEIGLPSVPHLRVIHAHSALVGGVAQMIFGGLLTFLPPLLMVPDPKKSRIFQYLLLNAGAAGMMIGFGTGNLPVVGFSGMAVGLAFLSLIIDALGMAQKSLSRPGLHLWFYGLAVVALLVGIGLGEMVAFGSFERERISLGRLAHLHLNLIGFVTLTIVGTMHAMFPTVTHAKLHSDRLAIAAFVVLPLGVAGLIAGFLLAAPWVQIAAGIVLLAGTGTYGVNMLRTWLGADTRTSLPVLHLLCGTAWLVLTAIVGILLAWNDRTEPPYYPIGTAHLFGYSHIALVGFILQTIMGALSHLLPVILTLTRIKSQKKRRRYLDALTSIVERGKWLQLTAFNLGTAGMMWWALSAGLFGLRSVATASALWVTAGLLIVSLGMFAGKVAMLVAKQPEE